MREAYNEVRAVLNEIRGVIEIINLSRKCGVNKHNLRQLHCLEEALYARKQRVEESLNKADKLMGEK